MKKKTTTTLQAPSCLRPRRRNAPGAVKDTSARALRPGCRGRREGDELGKKRKKCVCEDESLAWPPKKVFSFLFSSVVYSLGALFVEQNPVLQGGEGGSSGAGAEHACRDEGLCGGVEPAGAAGQEAGSVAIVVIDGDSFERRILRLETRNGPCECVAGSRREFSLPQEGQERHAQGAGERFSGESLDMAKAFFFLSFIVRPGSPPLDPLLLDPLLLLSLPLPPRLIFFVSPPLTLTKKSSRTPPAPRGKSPG